MILASDPATDERAFAARTTTLQLPYRLGLRRAANYAEQDVLRWLMNGWTRSTCFNSTPSTLPGEALRHSLHWAFPQAYYAVFALTLGYFRTVGFTEDSHAGVIRKIGMEMQAGHYPANAFISGARRQGPNVFEPRRVLAVDAVPVLRRQPALRTRKSLMRISPDS